MNVRKWEEAMGLAIKLSLAPLWREVEELKAALQTERRLAALEQRAGMPDDSVTKFYRGDSMSAAEYLALCERLRPPLVYGAWRPEHASWK